MKKYGKKFLMILLSLVLIISSIGIAYAENNDECIDIGTTLQAIMSDLKVNLNGSQVLDRIVVIDGTSYLPVRKMSELLGADIKYNEENRTVEIENNQASDRYYGSIELVYSNGTVYKGDIKNGLFNGDGTLIYPDGSMYEGNFINGIIEGKGEYTSSSGNMYIGQFKNNEYFGHGKYIYLNGDTIEGDFEGDKLSRYIRVKICGEDEERQIYNYKWTSPIETMNISEKTFNLDKYNGTADIIYGNGNHYDGAVTNGCFNGYGTLVYQDGKEYKGNWIMNEKSGKGSITYADGTMYKGYFVNDKYDGDGKMYYVNGDIYDGAWKQNKKEGYGKYIESNGNYFYGMWLNDVKHTLKENDDEDYKGYGTYVINKKNTIKNEGETYKQKWSNGELISKRKDN